MTSVPDTAAPARRFRVPPSALVVLVSMAAFMGPFTQTVYTPILPDLGRRFHTSVFVVNLTISLFTVVLAVMQIVYGPLTDRRGRRAVLVPGLVLYAVASVACAFSPSAPALLASRALQAVGIAAGSVVATTVIADLFTGAARGRAMGTFQMLVAMGSVIGPVVGGAVAVHFGFRGIFLLLAAIGVVLALAQMALLPETRPDGMGEPRRMRLADFARILGDARGSAVILLGIVQYYAYYCFLVFLPEILRERYRLTADRTGLAFLPLSLGVVIGSFAGGRLQARFNGPRMLVVTSLLNAASLLLFIFLSGWSLPALLVGGGVFGLLLGLSLPVQTTILADAFVRDRATAIGVYNFGRYLGMAAGPMLGAVLFHRGGVPLLFGFGGLVFAASAWIASRRMALAPTA
ncbi:MFS transporter [Longimicrobium terrae]|uniref:Putative MFS family arabinose efflux permease n=1 Tax=Longimicrobium terrae TaxID=1639882 RepID=A0A841GXJ1_9BACT|nr:MFS transporter [Longimicrobium terrae]MBB4636075.1 putative MFS family arabinose efflux permease [Longimicrobium terrae]MBB6070470.1 putative MFS family arabinose efflux permease [Longimicrobium terrae]